MKKVYISSGNLRMNVPTWSIPSGITCPNKTPSCDKYCYAKKAERVYKAVLPSRKRNYYASLRDDFVEIMCEEIDKLKSEYFRVHESGDMYGQNYLDKWFEISRRCSDKKFLVYSQMWDLDWSNKPNNMVVYWSIWPDAKNEPNDGLKAYVYDDGTGKIGDVLIPPETKICVKGHGPFKDLKCNDCMYCYNGEGSVAFKLH